MSTTPQEYMFLALQLAARGKLTVSPNPQVGCVIVKDGQIVGQGWHQRAGEAHAEVLALSAAKAQAVGASLFVNLEPCCHYGRTPPCVEAIIAAGISKVYVACLDPNPLMSGKGVAALKAAGIAVELGLYQTEAQQQNEIFFHYITHRQPFIIAKWAMSLDGKTITQPQDSKFLSGSEASLRTHELRQEVDAILIGAQTAIDDDPLLTVRLSNRTMNKQPLRIILSSRGTLPLHLKIFDSDLPGKTLVVTTHQAPPDWCNKIVAKNVELIKLSTDTQGRVDLKSLLKHLGQRNITSVLVEGGMTIHEAFFSEQLVNRIQVYVAPVIIGSLAKKKILQNLNFSTLGRDYCFTTNVEGDVDV